MVRTEGESPSQQVVSESKDRPLDGQTFFLDCAVFRLSLIESFRQMYSMGRSTTWDNSAPSPWSDASVCKTKGREKPGECNNGPPHSAAFILPFGTAPSTGPGLEPPF